MDEYLKRKDLIIACKNTYPDITEKDNKYDVAIKMGTIFKKLVYESPPADVVQRSDYDAVVEGQLTLQKHLANVKQELAMEIFEKLMKESREIADRYEKAANETSDHDYARIEYRGCQMGALLVLFKIAELKKKYLGEN
jgi:hypothetical protein